MVQWVYLNGSHLIFTVRSLSNDYIFTLVVLVSLNKLFRLFVLFACIVQLICWSDAVVLSFRSILWSVFQYLSCYVFFNFSTLIFKKLKFRNFCVLPTFHAYFCCLCCISLDIEWTLFAHILANLKKIKPMERFCPLSHRCWIKSVGAICITTVSSSGKLFCSGSFLLNANWASITTWKINSSKFWVVSFQSRGVNSRGLWNSGILD